MLEVGSGNSTMFASKAIRDFGLPTHLFSIDPVPRGGIDRLCDELHRESVLTVPLETFDRLGPSDILFIDGSHLVLNGSDTTRLFLEVIPRLADGVYIHVHDICLPYEYSSHFDRRGYAEQYLLSALLLFSKSLTVVWPVYKLAVKQQIGDQTALRMARRFVLVP